MKQLLVLNPEKVSEEEANNYPVREAARAVVVDEDGRIALLHVSKFNYYKLPGGGLEGSEDRILALQRECKEEVGANIDVMGEIGSIVEYRKSFHLKQISYCYVAKLKGTKGTPTFTQEEIKEGFKEIWVPYEDAHRLMAETTTADFEGSAYIVPRDTIFLEKAKEYLMNIGK